MSAPHRADSAHPPPAPICPSPLRRRSPVSWRVVDPDPDAVADLISALGGCSYYKQPAPSAWPIFLKSEFGAPITILRGGIVVAHDDRAVATLALLAGEISRTAAERVWFGGSATVSCRLKGVAR